jgi:hypothetical protein
VSGYVAAAIRSVVGEDQVTSAWSFRRTTMGSTRPLGP